MTSVPPLLSFLLVVLSGWVHRHQSIVVEFLQAETTSQKATARKTRTRHRYGASPTGAEGESGWPQSIARLGHDCLARHTYAAATPIVAQKWNFIHRRKPGRLGIMRQIPDIVLRMAEQNPCWGYTR